MKNKKTFETFAKQKWAIWLLLVVLGVEVGEKIMDLIMGDGDGIIKNELVCLWLTIIQIGIVPVFFLLRGLRKSTFPHLFAFVVTLIIVIATFEMVARLAQKAPWIPDKYVELLEQENIPEKIKWIKQWEYFNTGKHKLKYYDYHLFALSPAKGDLINITDYYSARKVPDSAPLGTGDLIIWAFGGSTLQNLDSPDSLTLANYIAISLKEKGINPTIFNFGVGTFHSSIELAKFIQLLRKIPKSEKPDMVIFYDGYNDGFGGATDNIGGMDHKLSFLLKWQIEENYEPLILYNISKYLSVNSVFWDSYINPNVSWILFGNANQSYTERGLHNAVEAYELNTRIIRSICDEFQIEPLFLLQPMLHTKKKLTPFEKDIYENLASGGWISFMDKFYEAVRSRMAKYPDFHDISDVFDNSRRTDYFDQGHTGYYSDTLTGRKVADVIYPIVHEMYELNQGLRK